MVASLLPSKCAVPSLNHHLNVVEGFACPVITGDMLCGSICPWSDLPRQTGSGWGSKSDPLHRIGWGSGGCAPKQPKATACICPAVYPPPTGGAVGISLGVLWNTTKKRLQRIWTKKPADINATLLETLVYMHTQFPLNAFKADRRFQLVNGRICRKH